MSLKAANQKETNRVELEVEVDAATFEAAVQKAYRKNIGKLNVPGFRRGKAPRQFVEKIYGEGVFYEDVLPFSARDTVEGCTPAIRASS